MRDSTHSLWTSLLAISIGKPIHSSHWRNRFHNSGTRTPSPPLLCSPVHHWNVQQNQIVQNGASSRTPAASNSSFSTCSSFSAFSSWQTHFNQHVPIKTPNPLKIEHQLGAFFGASSSPFASLSVAGVTSFVEVTAMEFLNWNHWDTGWNWCIPYDSPRLLLSKSPHHNWNLQLLGVLWQ